MPVIKALIMIFITSCNSTEQKQMQGVQIADTIQKENNQQSGDTSVARVMFPGGDVIQLECEFVQGQAEVLLEEYHQQGTTDKRMREIVVELEKLNNEWKEKDCQQVFGFMIPEIPNPPGKGKI